MRVLKKLGNSPGVGKCLATGKCKICKCVPSPGLKRQANAPQYPGEGWVQLELTDALIPCLLGIFQVVINSFMIGTSLGC